MVRKRLRTVFICETVSPLFCMPGLNLWNIRRFLSAHRNDDGVFPLDKTIRLRILRITGENRYQALYNGKRFVLVCSDKLEIGQSCTGMVRRDGDLFRFIPSKQPKIYSDTSSMPFSFASAPTIDSSLTGQMQIFLLSLMQLKGLKTVEEDREQHPGPPTLPAADYPDILDPDLLKERMITSLTDRENRSYILNRVGGDPHWICIPLCEEDADMPVTLYFLLDIRRSEVSRASLVAGRAGHSLLFAFHRAESGADYRWKMRLTVEDAKEFAALERNLPVLKQKLRNLGVKMDDTVNRIADGEDLSVYAEKAKQGRSD